MLNVLESTLTLFNAVPINKNIHYKDFVEFYTKTIPLGFILDRNIINCYTKNELNAIINKVHKYSMVNPQLINNTFHKSWNKIRNSKIENLVLEQIIHYFSTYGMESIGQQSINWIPNEHLNIPNVEIENLKITIIRGLTPNDLKIKLLNLLNSGIALSKDAINHVINIVDYIGDIGIHDIDRINNKEVKCILYDRLGIIPKDPVEFLRFFLYKTINSTLLIKDRNTINAIKAAALNTFFNDNDKLLFSYIEKYGLNDLASIFYRFKPLFLAMKNKKNAHVINKMRKLAVKYHKQCPEDYINNVIKNLEIINVDKFTRELNSVNVFRRVKLINALLYRLSSSTDIVYNIRNGKSFATKIKPLSTSKNVSMIWYLIQLIEKSIVDHLKIKIGDKKIYLPNNIVYAVPESEKKFIGPIPNGSYVKVDNTNMIFGVQWFNLENLKIFNRIDLDLALLNKNKKIGWDGGYRDLNHNDILFSGDMTDAPKPDGASEAFNVTNLTENFLVTLNDYSFRYNLTGERSACFSLYIAKGSDSKFCLINPNNIILNVNNLKLETPHQIIGHIHQELNAKYFYFNLCNISNSITSYYGDTAEKTENYLINYNKTSLKLNDLLYLHGFEIIEDSKDADIDLSAEQLSKTTLLDLFI